MGHVSAVSPVTAARQLALAAATVEVLDAMAAARIRPLMLKGAAIATRLYDNPSERLAEDVDLLVAPRQAPVAAEVLKRLGFADRLSGARTNERCAHAVTFDRGGSLPATIDLHTTLCLCHRTPETLWREFSRATTFIKVANQRIEVLDDPAQALVIVAHAVQHIHAAKPREDLRRALDRYQPDTWVNAAAMARRLDTEAVFAVGLRLSDAGRRVADELALEDGLASPQTRLRLAGAPVVSAGVLRFAETRSIRPRLMLLLSELFPSRCWMRLSYPFAARGSLALTLAYLYRPLWLARKLPSAIAAWRRATRSR
jgi:hypothetical protein